MLVLSRKQGESIIINDTIVVTVLDIQRDRARLGFEAPKEVRIYRQEIYEAMKRAEAGAPPQDES